MIKWGSPTYLKHKIKSVENWEELFNLNIKFKSGISLVLHNFTFPVQGFAIFKNWRLKLDEVSNKTSA